MICSSGDRLYQVFCLSDSFIYTQSKILLILIMKRPSNLVLAFILAVAATFVTWIGWLVFSKTVQSPDVEIEENFESQLDESYS